MKNILFAFSFLFLIGNSYAQKVKFKKELVLINNVNAFKYSQDVWTPNVFFTSLDSNEMIFSQEINIDGTVQITFYEEKVTFETKRGYLPKKALIKDLLKNKVINERGEISSTNLQFYMKKNKLNAMKIIEN